MQTERSPIIASGWVRALLYVIGVALFRLLFAFAGSLVGRLFPGAGQAGGSMLPFAMSYMVTSVGLLLFTWLVQKLVNRQSFSSLGFTWQGFENEAGIGFFSALALLGIGSLILLIPGFLVFTGARFDAGSLVIGVGIMVAAAFSEEVVFRGYLLGNLMESMNKWVALVITALLFAAAHISNPDVTVFGIISVFFGGLLLGINFIFTRNLWFGIFFHFAWNFYQGPVLGYDVSGLKLSTLLQQSLSGPQVWTGGAFGFEGTLLCDLLVAAAVVIFALAFKKRYEA